VLAGCTTSHQDEPAGGPRRDLAGRPESLPPDVATTGPPASGSPGATTSTGPSGSASASVRPGASGSVPPASRPLSGATSAGPAGGPPAAPFHQVGTTSDGRRDAGAATPGYADLRTVTVEDDGTNARVTVTFDTSVPGTLPADETMGVGVDFFRSAAQIESDYQLFADGEPDGWFAYLQTPKGMVRYPGTFGIGGRRLVFTVPWSSLGSPGSGSFSAFADWTRDTVPTNVSGEDHAPNLGTARFTR
jgi:hypothetical protein